MNGRLNRTMHTVAASLAVTVASAQWTFRLDTTFRTTITEKNVNHMALLSNGDLLLSGRIRFQSDPPWVSADRLLASVDPDGEEVPGFPYGYGGGKLTEWADRYYVSVGQTVRRVFPSGLVDPLFIGLNTNPYFSALQGGDYHVYSDGRVLISGIHDLSDTARGFVGKYNLIWFSNEGYLDTTRTHRVGNGFCTVNRFAELPNDQFICSSTCNIFEGKEIDRIFRVNADGTPDTTFRTGVYYGGARAYLPLADGRVYVGGNFRRTEAPEYTLQLVRFMPDGSLDPTFSIPQFDMGGQGISAPFGPFVYQIIPWKPGYLLLAGEFRFVNGEPRSSICMIDSTGQLTPAFAGNWMGTFSASNSQITNSLIVDILPNADTTAIYICGAYTGYGDGEITDPTQRFVSRLLVEEDTGTTGVREVAAPKPPVLRLHPNPASGWVSMNYHLPGNTSNVHMVVRDAQGRTVQQFNVRGTQGQHAWDVQGLAPGVYMVELRREGRVEGTERLVIQP